MLFPGSFADSAVTGPQRKSFLWLRKRFWIRSDTEGSRFAVAISSASSSSSSSSRRGRGGDNPGVKLWKFIGDKSDPKRVFGKRRRLNRPPCPASSSTRKTRPWPHCRGGA